MVEITEEEANKIKDVLSNLIEFEDCFKDEVGRNNCLHCQIYEAQGYFNKTTGEKIEQFRKWLENECINYKSHKANIKTIIILRKFNIIFGE